MGGHRPFFTYVFIIFAVVLQLHMTLAPAGTANALIDNFALTPAYVLQGRALLGLFLYMFLHADWSRLLANCFALWGVGSVIEPEIGSKYTAIAFYASAFFGGVVHTLLNPSSNLPLVGISGGVLASSPSSSC
jgi:membrane associated rhomboid family serine protease